MNKEIGAKVVAEKKNRMGQITETIRGTYRGYDGDGSDKIEQNDGTIRYVDHWLTKSVDEYDEIISRRYAPKTEIEMVKCACGHTVSRSMVMSASMGSSCSECYDRMSN